MNADRDRVENLWFRFAQTIEAETKRSISSFLKRETVPKTAAVEFETPKDEEMGLKVENLRLFGEIHNLKQQLLNLSFNASADDLLKT